MASAAATVITKTITILATSLAFPVIFLLRYDNNTDKNKALQVRECYELKPIKPNYSFVQIRCNWQRSEDENKMARET